MKLIHDCGLWILTHVHRHIEKWNETKRIRDNRHQTHRHIHFCNKQYLYTSKRELKTITDKLNENIFTKSQHIFEHNICISIWKPRKTNKKKWKSIRLFLSMYTPEQKHIDMHSHTHTQWKERKRKQHGNYEEVFPFS